MNEENSLPAAEKSLVLGFKNVCMRVGAVLIVIFALRYLLTFLIGLAEAPLLNAVGAVRTEIIVYAADTVFLFILPITATKFLLRFPLREKVGELYAKPRYMARSFGLFPAMYGLSTVMAFIMVLLSQLFSGTFAGESMSNSPLMNDVGNDGLIVVSLVYTVIFAPIFEELWFRGLILQSLRPYGDGFAIFVSALMFAVAHANLMQFSYAFVAGVIFAYTAVQTRSLIPSMVMHFAENSIASVSSILLMKAGGIEKIAEYLQSGSKQIPAQLVPLAVWMAFIILFASVGIIMAIVKLAHIKRYKLPKVQTELGTARRWGIFLSRATVIIGLVIAIDAMVFGFVYSLL